MDDQPQVIEKEMEETRTALTSKLEALEAKVTNTVSSVTDTVQSATDAVTETVESVKDAVSDVTDKVAETFSDVKDKVVESVESVGHALNPVRQMERHPWPMFGGAVALGFLGSRLLGSRRRPEPAAAVPPMWSPAAAAHYAAARPEPAPEKPKEPSKPGWFGEQLGQLRGLAVGALMGALRDLTSRAVPESLRGRLAEQLDSITSHLGGEPVRGPVLTEPEADEHQGDGHDAAASAAGTEEGHSQGRRGAQSGRAR